MAAEQPAPPMGARFRLAVAAASLALIAMLTAVLPLLSLFTWLFSSAALVVAVASMARREHLTGLAIAAGVVAAIAWILAIFVATGGVAIPFWDSVVPDPGSA